MIAHTALRLKAKGMSLIRVFQGTNKRCFLWQVLALWVDDSHPVETELNEAGFLFRAASRFCFSLISRGRPVSKRPPYPRHFAYVPVIDSLRRMTAPRVLSSGFNSFLAVYGDFDFDLGFP